MGVMASGDPRHEAGVGSKLIIVVALRSRPDWGISI